MLRTGEAATAGTSSRESSRKRDVKFAAGLSGYSDICAAKKRVLPLIGVEESDTIDANESACLIKALFCGGRSRE